MKPVIAFNKPSGNFSPQSNDTISSRLSMTTAGDTICVGDAGDYTSHRVHQRLPRQHCAR